jgi:plasminogen activator inhibitor 1 RNA-binding protein
MIWKKRRIRKKSINTYFRAHDSLNPNDPDAEERRKKFNNDEADDNTKTLGEYLSERKSQPVRLPEARKANEGSSDDQWKGAVALEKKEDAYFVGKAHKK